MVTRQEIQTQRQQAIQAREQERHLASISGKPLRPLNKFEIALGLHKLEPGYKRKRWFRGPR